MALIKTDETLWKPVIDHRLFHLRSFFIMKRWSTWTISSYENLRVLCSWGMLMSPLTVQPGSELRPDLAVGVKMNCVDPSPPLPSHLTPHTPLGTLADCFQNNPWEACSCSQQQWGSCSPLNKREPDRWMDTLMKTDGWMDYRNQLWLASATRSIIRIQQGMQGSTGTRSHRYLSSDNYTYLP